MADSNLNLVDFLASYEGRSLNSLGTEFNEELTHLHEYLDDLNDGEGFYQKLSLLFNGMKPSEFYDVLTQDLGFQPDVILINNDQGITLEVDYQNEKTKFAVNRHFNIDSKKVVHVGCESVLRDNDRPFYSGTGMVFLRNSLMLYKALDLREVVVQNPTGTGVQAWLKAGFIIDPIAFDEDCIREAVELFVEEELDGFSEPVRYQILELVEDYGPSFLQELYFLDRDLFEAFMDEADEIFDDVSYTADLQDPEQLERFDRYFKNKGIIKSSTLKANPVLRVS